MKNILVLKHYKLLQSNGWDDHSNPVPSYDWKHYKKRYDNLRKYCEASAIKNIVGLDDIIVHNATVTNIQEAFKQHFFDLHDIWIKGDTNILYADLDVLFVRPFEWFEASHGYLLYNTGNSGVRYHGHDMDPMLWELAFERIKEWPENKWDYEQDIYIEMACQKPMPQDIEEYYWSLILQYPDNPLPPKDILSDNSIKAVHFHSTRDEFNVVSQMKDVWKYITR